MSQVNHWLHYLKSTIQVQCLSQILLFLNSRPSAFIRLCFHSSKINHDPPDGTGEQRPRASQAATSAIASDEQAQGNDGAVNPVVVDKRGWTPCGVLNGFEGDALVVSVRHDEKLCPISCQLAYIEDREGLFGRITKPLLVTGTPKTNVNLR